MGKTWLPNEVYDEFAASNILSPIRRDFEKRLFGDDDMFTGFREKFTSQLANVGQELQFGRLPPGQPQQRTVDRTLARRQQAQPEPEPQTGILDVGSTIARQIEQAPTTLREAGESVVQSVASSVGGAVERFSGALVPNQFDPSLSTEEAYAACGPAAAVAFARHHGRNPTLREALELAKSVGWTAQRGMAGPQSQVNLMQKMGIPARLEWDINVRNIVRDIKSGNPVILNSAAHYFVADAYNPDTDKYHVGASGTAFKAGSPWMTLDEMDRLSVQVAGSGLRGVIYTDNPLSTEPSVAQERMDVPGQFPAAAFPEPTRNPATDLFGGLREKFNQGLQAVQAEAGRRVEGVREGIEAGVDIASAPMRGVQAVGRETGLMPPIGVSEEEARKRAERLPQIPGPFEAIERFETGVSEQAERAGVPGRERAPIDVGPIETSPAQLTGFAAGMALPGGGARRAAQSANVANRTLGKMFQQAVEEARPGGLLQFAERQRRNFVRAWTDRQVDLAKFQEEAGKAKGAPLTPDEMAAELRRLDPNKAAQVRLQESLRPALLEVGNDQDWLATFLAHQDNIDVAAATGNAARRFSGGISVDDSRRAVEEMVEELGPERFRKIQQSAERVWKLGDELLKRKVDAGLITQELYDTLRTRFPHYTPTRIVDYLKEPERVARGRSLSVADRGLRTLTIEGTTKGRENPLSSMVRAAHETEQLARRNEAFNAFIRLRDHLPNGTQLIREVPDSVTPTRDFVKLTGFVNGQRRTFLVPKEIENIIKAEATAAIPYLSTAMSVFRALATSRNPVFLGSNAMLDAATFSIRSTIREGGTPAALFRVIRELVPAYNEAFRGIWSGTYQGDAARFLKEGGGLFGFFQGTEKQARQTVAELSKRGALDVRNADDLKRIIGDILTLRPVEAVGERIEMAPRVAAFRLAERRGLSTTQAVIQGRTVTIDFAQGGNVSKVLNQFIPFFNVGVQALAQPVRAGFENPRAAMSTAIALLAGPTVAAEAWNRADPQRAKDYEDVPDYIKRQGVVAMLPGEAPVDERGNRRPQFVLLRLREFAPIAVLAREASGQALGAEPSAWHELLRDSIEAVAPVSGPGDIVPLGLNTAVQAMTDRDFWRDRRITSVGADERASTVSKQISELLFQMGIDEARPSMVEFVLRDLFPGTGHLVLESLEATARQVRGEPVSQGGTVQDIPVVGRAASRLVRGDIGGRLQQARDEPLAPAVRDVLHEFKIGVGGAQNEIDGIPLTLQEQAHYQELLNEKINEFVGELLEMPTWQRQREQTKDRLIRNRIDRARTRAKVEVKRSIGSAERSRRRREAREEERAG